MVSLPLATFAIALFVAEICTRYLDFNDQVLPKRRENYLYIQYLVQNN